MKPVLEGTPLASMKQPDNLEFVRINRDTGLRARPDEADSFFEVFRKENVPGFGPDQGTDSASEQEGSLSPF